MKLSALHRASARALAEGIDPGVQEKLGVLQTMVSRQGKDPEPFMRRLRGMIDPGFARSEGYKATFQNWVKGAQLGETKTGRSYGRKIRVTVLEAVTRQLIGEGLFSDLGSTVLAKIRDLFNDGETESEAVSKAIDEFPVLAWILRYAQRAEKPLIRDEVFWQKLDELTGGMGQTIRQYASVGEQRVEEMRRSGIADAGLLTECAIIEARISELVGSLGVEPVAVKSLMGDFGIRDDEFDLSRMHREESQPDELALQPSAGGSTQGPLGLTDSSQMAPTAQAPAQQTEKPVNPAMLRQIQQKNMSFAQRVIEFAAILMKAGQAQKAGAQSPQQAVDQATQSMGMGSGTQSPAGAVAGQGAPATAGMTEDLSVIDARSLLR